MINRAFKNIGLAETTTSNSILQINISGKTTDIGPPIGQPSTCFNNFAVTKNTCSFVNLNKSFLNIDFLHKGSILSTM